MKKEEGGYSLLDGAIESYLTEILSDNEYDNLSKKKSKYLKRKYRTRYYDVAEQYNLPRPTDLPRYLKLISDLPVKPS